MPAATLSMTDNLVPHKESYAVIITTGKLNFIIANPCPDISF